MSFEKFNFTPSLNEALDAMGFKDPTPIQDQAIPMILDNSDLIACAQTGTGKTAAFLLPIIHKIASEKRDSKHIHTLIIAPTRELAQQIDQQVEALGYFVGVSSIPVYGGGDSQIWDQQKRAITDGVDIIIATPGRFLAHLNMGYLKLDNLQHLILDEADRMLDMGFLNDIMTIVKMTPKSRQTLLFSATMPSKIRGLSNKILKNPKQINIAISKPAEGILQGAYLVYPKQKVNLITHLLTGKENYQSVLIFSSTKRGVNDILNALKRKKFSVTGISSDLDQKQREESLMKFKNKSVQILVATDIIARGIDIKEINLVINYDVPSDAEDYVHRIGRTARADSTGVALTLISDVDVYKFMRIEEVIDTVVRKFPLPPEIGEGPPYVKTKSSHNHRGRGGGGRGRGGYNRNRGRGGKGGGNNRRGGNNNNNNRGNNSSRPPRKG